MNTATKTFLSIGSGPGIGLATAEKFAEAGYRVVLTSRNQAALSERVEAINANGHTAEGRYVDASNLESVVKLINDVESKLGAIDVLHFNSAALHEGSIHTQSVDDFVQDLATNIGAGFAAVKTALPGMIERGAGTLLLTGGIYATTPNPDYLALSVGKAGLRNLTHALFDGLKSRGVHIAMVTVAASVSAGSPEAKAVAQACWELHSQPRDQWTAEIVYSASQQIA